MASGYNLWWNPFGAHLPYWKTEIKRSITTGYPSHLLTSLLVTHRFSCRQLNLTLVHAEFVADRVSMRSEEFCRTWHKMPLSIFCHLGLEEGAQPPQIQETIINLSASKFDKFFYRCDYEVLCSGLCCSVIWCADVSEEPTVENLPTP
jgi:hypothetical protein